MTSPLPPRRRDTRDLYDLARQDRTNLRQLDRGLLAGRFPPARPLSAAALSGDNEDDDADTDIGFENGDRTTAAGPGTVTLRLTYTPLPGSLHIRWNGLDQPPTEWAVEDSIVTIPDPYSLIRAGDAFTAAYAYDLPDDPDQPAFIFIGATSLTGSGTALALHADTQPGDLLVFASAAMVSASSSDSRLTGTIGTSYGTGALVKWGIATALGPVSCSVDGGFTNYATTVCAVYRGVTVTDFAVSTSGTSDITMPAEADANAAIGVLLAWDGTVAGPILSDSTFAWNTATNTDSGKTHVEIVDWQSPDAQTTPPGAFHHQGDWNGYLAATLKLGAT